MKTTLSFLRYSWQLLLLFPALSSFSQLSLSVTTTPDCNMSGSAVVTVSGGVAPFTYEWDRGYYGQIIQSGTSYNQADSIDALFGGYYYVHVRDSAGAEYWGSALIVPPFTLFYTTEPDTCSKGKGSAIVTVSGGLPPYTYLWSNGQTTQTATGLLTGIYNVGVVDANGCYYSTEYNDSMPGAGIYVGNYSSIVVTINKTTASCHDGTASAIPSGGSSPYYFLWDTSPPQTTQQATGLNPQSYIVTVTSEEGCMTEAWVWIQPGGSPFYVNINTKPDTCNAGKGTATVSVTGGAPPYTYQWSNGQTGTNASGLSGGNHSVRVTDASNCFVNSAFFIGTINKDLTVSFSSVNPTCDNSNGSATVAASNGIAPYTYLWNNGQTTSMATGLGEGVYCVNVTDNEGCERYKCTYLWEPDSCKIEICGIVYHDFNDNCIPDPLEMRVPDTWINIDLGYWSWNWYNGEYHRFVDPGTYTITCNPPPYWFQTCPPPPETTYMVNAVNAGDVLCGNDFGLDYIPNIQDLRIHPSCGFFRPGFENSLWLCYENVGTIMMNGQVSFTHDSLTAFITSNPLPQFYDAASRTIYWNFSGLEMLERECINITLFLPASVTLGTVLHFCDTIEPIQNDSTPQNNSYCWNCTVEGSYDPNFKEVIPEGKSPAGNISPSEKELTYMIHFQNTGTDTAFTVVIHDTINNNFDLETFHPVASSHPYTISFENPNVIVFTFDNILLPDSNTNVEKSNGFIQFTIQLKPALPNETIIKNMSAIYFDFNTPVLTNFTVNTIDTSLIGFEDRESADNIPEVYLYPNPASGKINLVYVNFSGNQTNQEFQFFNMRGALLKQINITSNHVVPVDVSSFGDGIYYIKGVVGNTLCVKKIVIINK